jgi:hypothetical protein
MQIVMSNNSLLNWKQDDFLDIRAMRRLVSAGDMAFPSTVRNGNAISIAEMRYVNLCGFCM